MVVPSGYESKYPYDKSGSATIDEINELTGVMKQTAAAEHGRDGDSIPVYAMAMGKPGDALYSRIEALAVAGVSQTIVPTLSPGSLADIGNDLVSRFG